MPQQRYGEAVALKFHIVQTTILYERHFVWAPIYPIPSVMGSSPSRLGCFKVGDGGVYGGGGNKGEGERSSGPRQHGASLFEVNGNAYRRGIYIL